MWKFSMGRVIGDRVGKRNNKKMPNSSPAMTKSSSIPNVSAATWKKENIRLSNIFPSLRRHATKNDSALVMH